MTTPAKDQRRDRRHEISDRTKARLEIEGPDGTNRHWPLAEVSAAGVSFVVGRDDGVFSAGTRFECALLVLGECRIKGALAVLYVSARSGTESLCGGLFYPASEAEQAKMAHVISGMELAAVD